jgi:uncharacterized RDD family membrane protein YckC
MGLTYQPPLASIGSRFLAILLDGLVACAFMLPGMAIIGFAMSTNPNNPSVPLLIFGGLLTFVLWMALLALLFVMWSRGQSPGKKMLGLRVIKMDAGSPATFWRMALREIVGKWVSGAICYLGYFWMLLDSNKQGWHDKIAGTIVVKEA